MALVSGLKVCLGDASVYRSNGAKWVCCQAFKCNCVQNCFLHFNAYLHVVF